MANDTTMTIVGNFTDDPELKFTPAGVAMAKFRIAATARIYDKTTGQWRDGDPLFLPCTAWRDLAEHVAESLSRGARVIVTGRLRQSHWETPEGEKRSMIQLDVDEIGPSLRFATAQVRKLTRTNGYGAGNGTGTGTSSDDAWATASTTRPTNTGAGTAGFADDEPPF